jgi:hypothetical protein
MARMHKDSAPKKNASRSDRLAVALRENLRRRKAQERAREESQPAEPKKPGPVPREPT